MVKEQEISDGAVSNASTTTNKANTEVNTAKHNTNDHLHWLVMEYYIGSAPDIIKGN